MLGDFFTSRATDLTQSPQLKEATADNTADVLLHRELIVEVDAEILYDRDRLDDVITDWKCEVIRGHSGSHSLSWNTQDDL